MDCPVIGLEYCRMHRQEAGESCVRRMLIEKRLKIGIEDSKSYTEKAMKTFSRLISDKRESGREAKVQLEALMEFLKFGFVMRLLVPNLQECDRIETQCNRTQLNVNN